MLSHFYHMAYDDIWELPFVVFMTYLREMPQLIKMFSGMSTESNTNVMSSFRKRGLI